MIAKKKKSLWCSGRRKLWHHTGTILFITLKCLINELAASTFSHFNVTFVCRLRKHLCVCVRQRSHPLLSPAAVAAWLLKSNQSASLALSWMPSPRQPRSPTRRRRKDAPFKSPTGWMMHFHQLWHMITEYSSCTNATS